MRVSLIAALVLGTLGGARDARTQPFEYGFADRDGQVMIVPRFDSVAPFAHGVALVKVFNSWSLVDRGGAWITDLYKTVAEPPSGISLFGQRCDDCPWDLVDSTGALVRSLSFPAAEYPRLFIGGFHGGFSIVRWLEDARQPGGWRIRGWIDERGAFTRVNKKLGLHDEGFGDNGLIPFKDSTNLWGYFDSTARVVIPATIVAWEARPFHHGIAVVRQDDIMWAIDRTGRTVIPKKRWKLVGTGAGAVRAEEQGRATWFDSTGKRSASVAFETAAVQPDGALLISAKGKAVLLDSRGAQLWSGADAPVAYLGDSVLAFSAASRYVLRTIAGHTLSDTLEFEPRGLLAEGLVPVRRINADAVATAERRERERAELEAERARIAASRIAASRSAAAPAANPGAAKARYVYFMLRQSARSSTRTMRVNGRDTQFRAVTWYLDYGYVDAPPGTDPASLAGVHEAPSRSLSVRAGDGIFLLEPGMDHAAEAFRRSGVARKDWDYLSERFLGTITR